MKDSLYELTKAAFDRDLEEIGVWVLYTRSDPRFLCRRCYDLTRQSADPGCEHCFGTGRKTELQPWRVYWSNSLKRPQEMNAPLTQIGRTGENEPVVYSRQEEVPVVGGRFLIVEWDTGRDRIPYGGRPARLVHVLETVFVDPYLIAETRPVYYIAHCNYVTESRNLYEKALRTAPVGPARR